jgi:hypothetical protein
MVEEPKGTHRLVARAPGELFLAEHVHEIRLDLLGGELVGRTPI